MCYDVPSVISMNSSPRYYLRIFIVRHWTGAINQVAVIPVKYTSIVSLKLEEEYSEINTSEILNLIFSQ